MRQEEIEKIQAKKRHDMIPFQPTRHLIAHPCDESTLPADEPHPRQDAHVPILLMLVAARMVASGNPGQSPSSESVLDGCEVGVRLDNHDELDVERVLCLGPEAEQDEAEDDARDGEGQVPVLEVLRARPYQEQARYRVDEEAERHGRVVHHAAQVAQLLRGCQVRRPEFARREQRGRAHRPPHLLREEGTRRVGADAAGQIDGRVSDPPAAVDCAEPRVHVFREAYLGSATHFDKGLSAVDCVAADTNRGTPFVSVGLHNPVEELLDGASALLHPGLLITHAEELRRLHYGGFGVSQVIGQEFAQEIRSRAEVGVEDDEEVAVGLCKSPAQIPCLPEPRFVISSDVVETIQLSECSNRLQTTIIQDVNAELPGKVVKSTDVSVGVFQHFQRLPASWQVYVHSRGVLWQRLMILEYLLVTFKVKVSPDDTNTIGDDQVNLQSPSEDTKPSEIRR